MSQPPGGAGGGGLLEPTHPPTMPPTNPKAEKAKIFSSDPTHPPPKCPIPNGEDTPPP